MANQRQIEENYIPLSVPKGTVERHWGVVENRLTGILPLVGGKYFIESSAFGGATADLRCRDLPNERAHRERGLNVPVVPLIEAEAREVQYWLNLHQEWREDLSRRSNRLVYHATGLTVFFGQAATNDKLQLFRAEWPGVRTQSAGVFVFEAPGAGHPHWQFDVYESRSEEVEEERKRVEVLAQTLDEITKIQDFGDTVVAELSPESLVERNRCMQHLSRAHFASCANWSKFPWAGDDSQTKAHAQGPAYVSEIENWIFSTLIYLTKELTR